MKIISLFQKFEHYTSIEDMPIFNWLKLQSENNLSWLLKVNKTLTKKEVNVLEFYLQKMTNEYIDTFGISDMYRNILKLKGEIRCLEIDLFLTNDKKIKTDISIKTAELKKLLNKSNTGDTTSVKVHAEKYMCRAINMRETSVKEFYEILNEMKKEHSKNIPNE